MTRLLLFLLSLPLTMEQVFGCRLQGWEMDPFTQPGDVLIGGLFLVYSGYDFSQPSFHDLPQPVSCNGFHIRYYRDVLGFIFAINEINNSPDFLPNISIGFSLLHSCMSELRAIGGTMSLMSGARNPIPGYDCHMTSIMVGIIGDMASALSLPVARILGVYKYPQVLRSLKKMPFQAPSGDLITFDNNGDISASYDIVTIQVLGGQFQLVTVGSFTPSGTSGHRIVLNSSLILWNKFSQVPVSACSRSCVPGSRRVTRLEQPPCCFDCMSCSAEEISNSTDAVECFRCPQDQWSNEERNRCVPKIIEFLSHQEPLGRILMSMVTLFSFMGLSILLTFIRFKNTPMIKATNRELSYILLMSLILCFLCCLVFIGQPTKVTCLLRQTFFMVVFSISISSVLAKTIMVILAFKATRLNSPLRKWLGPIIPRHVVGLCSGLQVVTCSVWLYKSPPFPSLNTQIENHKIIFECNEGHKLFFYMTLGFMAFLAMISFFVAFMARNLPGTYNEAKLITFSMLVFCCVWILFIPAYLSTSGKYTVAVQVFAILASSAGLLSCIFLPKCYIILLRPDMNRREILGHK